MLSFLFAGIEPELVHKLDGVRNAVNKYVANNAFDHASFATTESMLEQVSLVRSGRVDKIALRKLIGKEDKGTKGSAFKSFRGIPRVEAKIEVGEAFDSIVKIIMYGAPRDAPKAFAFYDSLKKLLGSLIDLGMDWDLIDKHYASVMRKVVPDSRPLAAAGATASVTGCAFDAKIFEAGTVIANEIHEDKLSQMAENVAAKHKKRLHSPSKKGGSPASKKGGDKEKEKKDKERKKKEHADGVDPKGTAVPFPGKDDPAAIAFNTDKGLKTVPKKGGGTRTIPFCWDYFHPQGCSRGAGCSFFHK